MAPALQQRDLDVNLRAGPQMREYEAIVARIARDRPGSVLDWGCGWGQVSDLLRSAGLDASAFDYDPAAEEDRIRPLERYPKIDAFLSSDPRWLPYEDASFDAVLSCGVLEHVVDPDASVAEIARVLRPGGTFYVYKLPNKHSYLEWLARRLGMYYHGAEEHDRIYGKQDAVVLLERHGLSVREFRRANMLPLTLAARPAQWATGAIWAANRLLSRTPGLNLLATNLELVASKQT